MMKFLTTSLALAAVAVAVHVSAQVPRLVPLTTFGTNGDGTIRPDDYDWVNSTNDIQRGMAYNPATGHLLVVCRTNASSPTYYRVMIVDATTGLVVTNGDGSPKQLDLSSLVQGGGNGSFLINLIGCADDGTIYAANLSNAQTPAQMALYRWANEDATMEYFILPDPASGIGGQVNRRWGDTFAVRGAGINTEILLASRGTVAAILKPADAGLSSYNLTTLQTDQAAGAIGWGLCFGTGSTFWGTSGPGGNGTLYHMSYSAGAGTATTLQSFAPTNAAFPANVSVINVLTSSNLLVGIDTRGGADITRLYDISNVSQPPVLLDRLTWFTNNNNNVFAGSVVFGTNGNVYALDSDNGISAYSIVSAAPTNFAPTVILQPANRTVIIGSNTVIYGAADGDAPVSYQWFYKASTNASVTVSLPNATNNYVSLTNLQLTNSGGYSFIATNAFGSITSSVAQLNVVSAPQSLYEGFDYTIGDILTGKQNPANNQIWYLNSGTAGKIEAGNLSYPGLPAPTGNRFTWSNASMSQRLPIGTNVSGTLYFSFLLKIDNLGSWTTSDTISGFGVNPADTAFSAKINLTNTSPGFYQIGLYKSGGTTVGSLAPTMFTTNDTVMIVGSYTFNTGANNDDVCNMWLNPDPSTFGADTPPAATVGPIGNGANDVAQLSYFFFRATTSPLKKYADELRIGYTWAEVTPLAPPTLAASRTSTNTVLVSWPSYYSSDYQLQSATNIGTPAWNNVTNPVGVSGSNKVVTVPSTSAQRYFRLIK